MQLVPDSFGSLREVWSDAARAASIAARQRRATVKGLKLERAETLSQMLNLISTYGGIRHSTSAQQAWKKSNDLSGQIDRLSAQRAPRPLIGRMRKAFKRYRRAA